ncbi:hypothetical protein [Arthrobacter bambusae]|uniref:Antitoxin n=1 Tax=Arthrobacter bambusae TaxID=1338426 RepID=A0AAW8DD97_9MICC|nr:hypothetical protein [Arthrobacter bambusae]MDP9903144.1 hypothetical protein [Arthrobacter bambusae]MDQ0128862.1 hypothetical protein [Arthrobacter bambusae]MDQ0180203.1 hypothetical protein [Arthrobacter bambusae]
MKNNNIPSLELNLEPAAETAFIELLAERGYPSINEFIVHTLKQDRTAKKAARIAAAGERIWPNGIPERTDDE